LELKSLDTCLLIILLWSFLLQLYYYLRYFLKLAKYEEKESVDLELSPISVIIAAKNEKENLIENLPHFLEQNYPDFEIVVVNDHSTDGTKEWFEGQSHTKLKCYTLTDKSGKKAAIDLGVRMAKYDSLLFSDADCRPASKKWMKLMAKKLKHSNNIVLGYGKYKKNNSFLNALIRFETIQTAVQYFSFALSNKAYMGVGRNLGYHKSLFYESTALSKYAHIKSGDDDLFINEIAKKSKVGIVVNAKAHTISKAESNWKSYYLQKRRHLEAGTKYKQSDRFRLARLGLSTLFFWLCLILLSTKASFGIIIFPIFAIKLILQYYIYGRIMQKLEEKDLIFWSPFLEFFYILWMITIGLSIWIWKVERWK